MSEVVWRPTPEIVERASVTRLMRRGSVAAYPELLRRSWEDPEWFWPLVVEDLVLECSTPWERVLDESRGPGRRRGSAWLFCCLLPGRDACEELAREISAAMAQELGEPFRPERVLFVDALPKTRSAKMMRRTVRAKALDADPGDLSSLENPEALEEVGRVVAA